MWASVLACLCVFLQVCGLRTMCMCIHVYMAAGCVHVYMAAGCVTSVLIVPSPHSLIISQLRLALATVHNFYAGTHNGMQGNNGSWVWYSRGALSPIHLCSC